MNKISKKIVSLVTMAAFALTLVPAAAFAAPTDPAVDSTLTTVDKVVKTGEPATVQVDVKADETGDNIVVWVQKDGAMYTDTTFAATTSVAQQTPDADADWADAETAFVFKKNQATTGEIEITLPEAGTYEVYAAVYDKVDAKNWGELTPLSIKDGDNIITVNNAATTDKSAYGVMVNGEVQKTAAVAVDTNLTTEFRINDNAGYATEDTLGPVYIWATQGDKVVEIGTYAYNGAAAAKTGKYITLNSVSNLDKVVLQFAAAGTYTLHASTSNDFEDTNAMLLGATVVTVTDETEVDSMEVSYSVNGEKTQHPLTFDETNTAVLNIYKDASFSYDGIDTITLNGKALDKDKKPARYQTINFTTTREDVIEFKNPTVDAHNDSDNTENDGLFETVFTMQDDKNGIITITDEATGLEYTIRVVAAVTSAQDINRTLTGGYVLAGNDDNWTSANAWFTDAVQFEVLDDKEETVTGSVPVKIDVRGRAANSTLEADDLAFVDSGNGVYTLMYKEYKYNTTTNKWEKNNRETDLLPGKYEVRVALDNGKSEDNATVTFTAAKFGKAQDTVLDVYAADHDWTWGNPNEEIMTVDDQITLGQYVGVVAKYVDENGIKIAAKDVSYGFNGKAVVDPMPKDGTFSTPANVPANESLLGTEVEIVAFNTAKNQLVTKTLTVVDAYSDKSLEFDPVQGPTNEDNKVTVSVVNEDGKVQQVEGTLDAWVVDQSNEDAKISVDAKDGRHAVQNGKGTLTVYSDQETTADIVVVVKAGTEAYYGTLEYTFGAEDPLADRTVVMTIDSTEYVVNNNIITGDAAPYIDSAWRTMVPIRALAEAFDAEVVWNQDEETVTINFDGDTQIVMTVGETTYTVNGNEATMDTEPVNTGSRVYVPIRFAAEGLGFSVTPLYNDAGLTASVVFQR